MQNLAGQHLQTRIDAHAKLNIRLKVVGRRADGYHLLSMLNVKLALCDVVGVKIEGGQGVSLAISFAPSIEKRLTEDELGLCRDPARNLAGKAASAFLNQFGLNVAVKIEIEKRVPLGGGLGGGSSDAAAVLLVLGQQLLVSTSSKSHSPSPIERSDLVKKLLSLATKLGADVPYFLTPAIAHVSGIGETVAPLSMNPLAGNQCAIVVPQESSSTEETYRAFRVKNPILDRDLFPYKEERLTRELVLEAIENDLEPIVVERLPEIGRMLMELRGCSEFVAGMTGSGSCLFVLPREERQFLSSERQSIDQFAASHGASVIYSSVSE